MSRFSLEIKTKRDFFNFVPDKYKQKIKNFIIVGGYTDPRDLREHIWECRVGLKFLFTINCLEEIIAHYTDAGKQP